MDTDAMNLTVENLKIVATELLEAATGDAEQKLLADISLNPQPSHRDGLIAIRDQALEQDAFEWALLLSHFIYAMTEPKFWKGFTIAPPTD